MTEVADPVVERSEYLKRIRPWLLFGVLFLAAGAYDAWRDLRMDSDPTWIFLVLGVISLVIWITRRREI